MYYYLFALISGAALTTQIGINGKLASTMESPVLTSFISFLVGTIALAGIYLAAAYYGLQPVPPIQAVSQTRFWMWLGGLFGAFYIFTTIICAPKIGFANMFSLVVAGQIILAIIFDHFGALGNPIHTLSPWRGLGVALLIVSVYIIQRN